jgi:hypothetical protein
VVLLDPDDAELDDPDPPEPPPDPPDPQFAVVWSWRQVS